MKEWINAHKQEQLELLKELASIPAPSHHEELRAKFICDYLNNLGYKVFIDEALNVVLPLNIDEKNDIHLFEAHIDTVFPDLEPLKVTQKDNILFAPGIGDDTANVVAILMALKYIKEKNLTPKEPVMFVLNSCEEGLGNLKGTKQIFKTYEGRIKDFISFDGIYGHGYVNEAVGSHRYKIICKTIGGHSYLNFGNPNAIAHMAKLVEILDKQEVAETATYNFGVINGGTSVNTIAQNVEMLYEYRSPSQKALEKMENNLNNALKQVNCKDATFELEVVGKRPGNGDVDEKAEEELIKLCDKAVTEVIGKSCLKYRSSSTDANIPLSMGIPATTFGLYLGDGEHTREEWLDVTTLPIGLEIGLKIILNYF